MLSEAPVFVSAKMLQFISGLGNATDDAAPVVSSPRISRMTSVRAVI